MRLIIISISSDIGSAIGERWIAGGHEVYGTYRKRSLLLEKLSKKGIKLFKCNLNNCKSIDTVCKDLGKYANKWDALIMCPGTQVPVGPFLKIGFEEWEKSLKINFLEQINILHKLMPHRNVSFDNGPIVLFFAGGAVNRASVDYSAYTISKIALIKMCELLDAEIPDTRFSIIGPGWVKTKIHEATLNAGVEMAGDNWQRTRDKLAGEDCTSMKDVLDSCEWILNSKRNVVSGRNFSTVFDKWGTDELKNELLNDTDMFKLRRYEKISK